MTTQTTPNPGSKEAVRQGCTCPVFDNNEGEGIVIQGTRCFWTIGMCPMHGIEKENGQTSNNLHKDACLQKLR